MSNFRMLNFRGLGYVASSCINKLRNTYVVALIIIIILFIYHLIDKANRFAIHERKKFITKSYKENDIEFNFDYTILAKKYNIDIKNLPARPYISGNTFKGLADHFIDDERAKFFNPTLVLCGQIIYVKTDYVDQFFQNYHPLIHTNYILLTHNSDYSIGTQGHLNYLNDSKLHIWFGQNVIYKHAKLIPIPIGIANEHWPHGNIKAIKNVSRKLKSFDKRKYLLYINFSVHTNKQQRSKTLDHFNKHFRHDSSVHFVKEKSNWVEYLLQLENSKFVISPPGNGIDCHRTWEALIMGATPVVLSSALNVLYENMPVMVVNDWSEVTEESLHNFYSLNLNISDNGVPLRPKIWTRYWINYFQNVKLNKCSVH